MFFAKEGWSFIFIPLVLGILSIVLGRTLVFQIAGSVLILLGLFCLFFFRDPVRHIPHGENLILSPCDGTVMEVTEEDNRKVIRVFLSVFNVHLQRSPVAGTIKSVEYRPGKFLPAMKPEAHSVNEQNVITISTPKGEYIVKQIAGILARRVVSWVKAGDKVEKGQRIGLIKFGSQVDVTFPQGAQVKVSVGDTVTAGETVIGELQ